jgi:hypothetical protein
MNVLLLIALFPFAATQLTKSPANPPALVVTGARVIFFGPTQTERDSIIHVEGIDAGQVFDDFDYYSGKVGSYLKRRGVGVIITTSPVIVVQFGDKLVRAIERKKLQDFVGIILTDGVQEPRLYLGVSSDEELVSECAQFFKLK